MWKLIDRILSDFRNMFSRQASFEWFVVIVMGLMVRTDSLGITSIIRELSLNYESYTTMNHFFRSNSWQVEKLITCWTNIIKDVAPICKVDEYSIIIGDGVKQGKESKKMPGVKRLHQESENVSKAEYIFGHMFGGIGILAGNAKKKFCIPVSIRIHDGVSTIRKWVDSGAEKTSHVVQTIIDGYEVAKNIGSSILVLDRYFLSVNSLTKLDELNKDSDCKMELVVKAKSSCVAYEDAPKYSGKGRKPKKGNSIKVLEMFKTKKNCFQKATLNIYGKHKEVSYYCINLLWGAKLYKKLRFVLVDYDGIKSILVSTKLDLDPIKIIELYSWRFKIECTFRELKQVISGFNYHFWSKAMPKLNRYKKKNEPEAIDSVTEQNKKQLIVSTLKAIEGYVMFSSIAIGMLQIISLLYSEKLNKSFFRYLRTPSNDFVSEATVATYIRKSIFSIIAFNGHFSIIKIIKKKQINPSFHEEKEAS